MPDDTPEFPDVDRLLGDAGSFLAGRPIVNEDGIPTTTGDVQALPWPCCITWDGRPYRDFTIAAPDPATALEIGQQLVALANAAMPSMGYPPLWGISGGSCQF